MKMTATVRAALILGGATVLAAIIAAYCHGPSVAPPPRVENGVENSPNANVVQAGGDVNVRVEPGRRVITPEGQQAMRGMLSGLAGSRIDIAAVVGDQDALALAGQLKQIFEAAGWSVDGVNQDLLPQPVRGIVVLFGSDTPPRRARAEQVHQALARGGLAVDHGELLARDRSFGA